MLISVVIPCYRSSEYLETVVDNVRNAIQSREGYDYQIILVNDGSPDETFQTIQRICDSDKKVIGVELSRNHGQGRAVYAGFQFIRGDVMVCMDDDGQHPAEHIFSLVDKVQEGWDVVYARFEHKKVSVFRRLSSWIHATLMRVNQGKPKDLKLSSFYALSRFMIEELQNSHAAAPNSYALMSRISTRITNLSIPHQERIKGKSRYNFSKRFFMWLDTMVYFSIAPLRVATLCGFIFAIFGFGYGLFLIIRKLVVPSIAVGYTSLLSVILFIGGLLMLMLGLMGEYIGRIYMMQNDAPRFTIREVLNEEEEE